MEYEWDENKRQSNFIKHGVDFIEIYEFDWNTAFIAQDERRDYGEPRFTAIGSIEDRLHVLVFTPRGDAIRIIGLRKANKQEARNYEEKV